MSGEPTAPEPAVSPSGAPDDPNRVLVWTGALVAGLVLMSAVAIVLSGDDRFDPTTPEGAVHGYLTAALAGDHRLADSYLSGAPATCKPGRTYFKDRTVRVEWIGTVHEGDTARVEVRVIEGSPGLFGGGEYSHRAFYTLERGEQGWLVIDQDWPWRDCPPESGSP